MVLGCVVLFVAAALWGRAILLPDVCRLMLTDVVCAVQRCKLSLPAC
jgi:hypothetical protein